MKNININGNIGSLKDSVLNEIESIYDLEISSSDLIPSVLAEKLAVMTGKINREISVYINRKGSVIDVSIGDSSTVSLPEFEGYKKKNRLSGIRCIHTHPNGDSRLSSVDISSLLSLRLDAMIALGVIDGVLAGSSFAFPVRDMNGEFTKTEVYEVSDINNESINVLFESVLDRERHLGDVVYKNESMAEKAILVGMETLAGRMINGKSEGERSLNELEELAVTAGVEIVQKIMQGKPVKDPAYHIGKGKVEQIGLICQAVNADIVIFDMELSGAQIRNIEEVVGRKVVDRTALILDIFAQRARSKEGKLQVELAQLKYRLPRLIGFGGQLSRLGGGIGTRGPGEKKLEMDRRHIKRRINFLESELARLSTRRGFTREGRRKNTLPVIALTGYTNAGKSTLMNALCKTDVFAENKLFATLDPTTRKLDLPGRGEALLIDTVGFIRKLPHELVEAFKSTLEEVIYADILAHVVDISSEEAEEQISVVNSILEGLGALNKPVMLILNKVDLVNDIKRIAIRGEREKVFEVSAVNGTGLNELIKGISELLAADETEVSLIVPYNEGWILPYLYENGSLTEKEYTESGITVKAFIKKAKIDRIKEYIVS